MLFRSSKASRKRVNSKSAEVTASLDQQFTRFRDALDGRTQTLNEALGSRVMDIAKTMAEGGKEVVGALDKRIADVTTVINVRGAKLAESIDPLAEKAKEVGVTTAVFDRGGFLYHGRVKALADAAREAGLEF